MELAINKVDFSLQTLTKGNEVQSKLIRGI